MLNHSHFSNITTFIFDVDGVLTDGSVHITEHGELLRRMDVKDGLALKMALDKGFKIAVITKGSSVGVRKRLEILGVKDIYDCLKDKKAAFNTFVAGYNLKKPELLYMGDDLPDIILKDKVAIFCCPNDATTDAIQNSDYISSKKGGQGCVREIIERVLKIQDKWN